MTDDGWTVIQRRIVGPVQISFIRKWHEYVEGFGYIDKSHWLGLDKIHRLTREGSQIQFDLEYYNGSTGFAQYKSFTVDDVTTAYTMTVDKFDYSGTMKELFSYHDRQKFSTYDRDNDNVGLHCAEREGAGGSGWWYNGCSRFGHFNGVSGREKPGGISFHDDIKYVYVKTVTIKVRPRAGMCSTLKFSDQ